MNKFGTHTDMIGVVIHRSVTIWLLLLLEEEAKVLIFNNVQNCSIDQYLLILCWKITEKISYNTVSGQKLIENAKKCGETVLPDRLLLIRKTIDRKCQR